MLIQVVYTDNRFDYVNEKLLNQLIKSNEIKRFRRLSGWVTIGVDPLRQFQRGSKHKPVAETKRIVQVKYNDNRFDYVKGDTLDTLIGSNKIVKIKRITGWITVGVDSLRKPNREHTYKYPNEVKKL